MAATTGPSEDGKDATAVNDEAKEVASASVEVEASASTTAKNTGDDEEEVSKENKKRKDDDDEDEDDDDDEPSDGAQPKAKRAKLAPEGAEKKTTEEKPSSGFQGGFKSTFGGFAALKPGGEGGFGFGGGAPLDTPTGSGLSFASFAKEGSSFSGFGSSAAGATTGFGGGFGAAAAGSGGTFGTTATTDSATADDSKKDEEEQLEEGGSNNAAEEEDAVAAVEDEPEELPLPLSEVTRANNGEQEEECLAHQRCKLLELCKANVGDPGTWKERGVGQVRILQKVEAPEAPCRLVMRREQTHNLLLNESLDSHLASAAKHGDTSLRLTCINKTTATTTYILRLKTKGEREILFDAFERSMATKAA